MLAMFKLREVVTGHPKVVYKATHRFENGIAEVNADVADNVKLAPVETEVSHEGFLV